MQSKVINNINVSEDRIKTKKPFSKQIRSASGRKKKGGAPPLNPPMIDLNNKPAAMMVNQTNPVEVELFRHVKTFFLLLRACW